MRTRFVKCFVHYTIPTFDILEIQVFQKGLTFAIAVTLQIWLIFSDEFRLKTRALFDLILNHLMSFGIQVVLIHYPLPDESIFHWKV
jgi:hypothetical protein